MDKREEECARIRRNLTYSRKVMGDCGVCVYFQCDDENWIDSNACGECRINPPQMNVNGSSRFPRVATDNWCGKFVDCGYLRDDPEEDDQNPN